MIKKSEWSESILSFSNIGVEYAHPFLQVMISSSSSSCRAASTDIPDPLSPLLPIVHRHWQAFRATFRILT